MLENIAVLAVSFLLLVIAAKLLALPFRLLKKFIINSIIGVTLLSIIKFFDIAVTINVITTLIVGIFGIPGVLLVLVWSYL